MTVSGVNTLAADSHQVILFTAVIFLVFYAMYSIVEYASDKSRKVETSYSNSTRPVFVILSLVLVYSFLGATITNFKLEHYGPSPYYDYILYLLHLADYWRYTRYYMDAWVYFYVYFWLSICFIVNTLFGIFSKFKPLETDQPLRFDPESKSDRERHCFVVVCHNSSGNIEQTLRALLRHVRPCQIFVADNGSTPEEEDKADRTCESLSSESQSWSHGSKSSSASKETCMKEMGIKVFHLKKGSKTFAQFSAVQYIKDMYEKGEVKTDLITILDDDVILPTNWSAEVIENRFEDESLAALNYGIRASNGNDSICAAFQDCEYLSGIVGRNVFDLFGSQLFASGAISTWKLNYLHMVLEKHSTIFDGEDLEMGYLIHANSGYSERNFNIKVPPRIGLVKHCIVSTVVPLCSFHWYDFVPKPLRRKLKPIDCPCGENSFFSQRFRSWDPAGHHFLRKFITIIMAGGTMTSTSRKFIKVYATWKLLSHLREFFQFFGFVMSLVLALVRGELLALLVFILDSVLIAWAFIVFYTTVQMQSMRTINLSVSASTILWYPILFDIWYYILLRSLVLIYTPYYLWENPFPPALKSQLDTDTKLKKMVLPWDFPLTPSVILDNNDDFSIQLYSPTNNELINNNLNKTNQK